MQKSWDSVRRRTGRSWGLGEVEVTRDPIHVSPHRSGVVLLELRLHPSPEALLATPDLVFKVPSHSLQFFPVSRSEGPLLLIQQGLELWGHPGFTVGEAPYILGWDSVLHAHDTSSSTGVNHLRLWATRQPTAVGLWAVSQTTSGAHGEGTNVYNNELAPLL